MHTIQIHLEVVDLLQRRHDADNEVQITAYDQSLPRDKRLPLFTFTCSRRQIGMAAICNYTDEGTVARYSFPGKMLSSIS